MNEKPGLKPSFYSRATLSAIEGTSSCFSRFIVAAVMLLACAVTSSGQGDRNAVRRFVTVRDSIQMQTLADPLYFAGGSSKGRVAKFSPSGKQFVVVLRRGNLKNDTNEFSLLLFRSPDVFHSVKPTHLLTMSSSSNRDAISSVKWLSDDETIVFMGENVGETAQLYSLNTRTKQLDRLTHQQTSITAFDITKDGKHIVYTADPASNVREDEEKIRREGVVITPQPLPELLAKGHAGSSWNWERTELFLQNGKESPTRISTPDAIWPSSSPISISPNGKYGILSAFVSEIPADWKGYTPSILQQALREKEPGKISLRLQRYLLLDMHTGTLVPLLNTPLMGIFGDVIWSPEGNSVYLKCFLPLNVADPAERQARQKHAFPIEVYLPSRTFRKITDNDWVGLRQPKANAMPTFDVQLEEGPNTPPKIYAVNVMSHRKQLLFDLNPQFSALQFGRVEIVTWKDADGLDITGGLYFPPNYVKGRRYPLVIQTHGFQRGKFWIDGPWSSAFAAQALAAQQIMVLQVGHYPRSYQRYGNTVLEGVRTMAAYQRAIDYLDKQGLIDKDRIGIVGFSRSVYYVEYTLTHSRYTFCAATLVDGIDAGYFNHVAYGPGDDVSLNGAIPIGKGLALWLKNSPGFNLDKIRTPIRLVALSHDSVLGFWETFSILSEMDKPVDFVMLPDATHMVVKPWERIVAQQGLVDWFRFWLKSEEDPDSSKNEEYARWRQLRRLYHQDEHDARCGKGTN